LRSAFKLCDVEFFHAQHGLHSLRILDQFGEARGHNLPAKAESVF